MNIDLHIHSSFSDGALTPSELVTMASLMGLQVIAIADHDSVAGVGEGISSGLSHSIEVIPAVELSVQFKNWQDVHLLGYGIDYCDHIFLERLNAFRERRERRNHEMLELVNKLLHTEGRAAIDIGEVLVFARDSIGRPHIARALLEKGYVENVEDAFRRYLVACNVPKSYWPIEDAIHELHRIGGVAILAHPTSISKDLEELRRIITDLKELGLNGLEVYNNLVYSEEMECLRRLALELGLFVTGGSDFHGIEDGLEMGKGRGGIRFSENLITPLNLIRKTPVNLQ
ncbi:MAG: PHP domain-containing protein [Deltaproteobacteria bacterium]|nr:PHP domain-containing protein [Deltaproteobacteria bacterium]